VATMVDGPHSPVVWFVLPTRRKRSARFCYVYGRNLATTTVGMRSAVSVVPVKTRTRPALSVKRRRREGLAEKTVCVDGAGRVIGLPLAPGVGLARG
jgi:hypothetical protein